MDEAADIDGYHRKNSSRSGKSYLTVDLSEVEDITILDELEELRSERSDTTTEKNDTTDDQEQGVESEAADQMNQLMDAQPARTAERTGVGDFLSISPMVL